jgi:hypothetical protein
MDVISAQGTCLFRQLQLRLVGAMHLVCNNSNCCMNVASTGCSADGADGDDSQQQGQVADRWQLEIQKNHAEHVSMAKTSGVGE